PEPRDRLVRHGGRLAPRELPGPGPAHLHRERAALGRSRARRRRPVAGDPVLARGGAHTARYRPRADAPRVRDRVRRRDAGSIAGLRPGRKAPGPSGAGELAREAEGAAAGRYLASVTAARGGTSDRGAC